MLAGSLLDDAGQIADGQVAGLFPAHRVDLRLQLVVLAHPHLRGGHALPVSAMTSQGVIRPKMQRSGCWPLRIIFQVMRRC